MSITNNEITQNSKSEPKNSQSCVPLKVPKCEIFDSSVFYDFYTIMSSSVGDLMVSMYSWRAKRWISRHFLFWPNSDDSKKAWSSSTCLLYGGVHVNRSPPRGEGIWNPFSTVPLCSIFSYRLCDEARFQSLWRHTVTVYIYGLYKSQIRRADVEVWICEDYSNKC